MAIRVDKTLIASIALHVLAIGWGLVSFSARSYEVPQESMPVDIISSDQLAKITAGLKNGEKDKAKPKVEKVAEAKPVDEAIGKVTEKEPIVTDSTPPPQEKPVDKPVEKKPDPPKPVTETKPKEEPKQAEKKPDPPKDPIADALKQEEAKKPKPKQEAKTPPPQYKPKERTFDATSMAKLIARDQDKRDPTRQTLTGTTLNASASYGMHSGTADSNVATWKGAFVNAVRRCFSFPYNGQDADKFEADIDIPMRPDGTVAADPVIVAVRGPSTSVATAAAESAKRAILQCQAYTFLPKEQYGTWKTIQATFGLTDLL
ncbi:cell envelope integrity protein TolA [Bradyrhizobium sp.]|uniref:cell envelope integrity protein TolA n=1 Tax=Bradyrhizobium sp. TaxID=376 RepID=UPI001DD92413|nr:protein TolA [Bradyrhizobium sp.]MBV8698890.1 protein TolA [Bradyrhizobium sp.]MBV8923104.1 protein TolA [Bradyrhizobium sp.]MBV9983187.1 protein TolA [Bradyrhizobium sp.]